MTAGQSFLFGFVGFVGIIVIAFGSLIVIGTVLNDNKPDGGWAFVGMLAGVTLTVACMAYFIPRLK